MKREYSAIIAITIVMTMIGMASATGIDTIVIGGDTQGLNGQTKSVTVDVSGMSAVGSLQLDVVYDPAVITVNSVTFGSVASGGLTASNINNTSGKVTIGIISATGISGTGNLATIFFTVAGNAGASTNIQIIKKNLKDFNVLPVDIEPIITGGTFTVITQLKGDVNTDGQINIVDALFIAQYTVNLRTLTPTQLTVADVNCDTTINIVDALFIAQHTVGLRPTFC